MDYLNMDCLKFDLQLFAEGEPTTDEPTTDEPTTDEPTTDEPTTDEPTTDEPTTDEKAKVKEEKTVYKVDGLEFTAEDLKDWKKAKDNYKKWVSKQNATGRELNQRKATLDEQEQQIKENKALLDEYRQVKKMFEEHPDAWTYVQKQLSQPGDKATSLIKSLEEKYDSKFNDLKEKEAILSLKSKYKDFDTEALDTLLDETDFSNPYQQYEALYFMLKGRNLDSEIQKARAKDSQNASKQRVLPPLSGSGRQTEKLDFEGDMDKAYEAAMRDLKLGR